jgi:hypothetical protein
MRNVSRAGLGLLGLALVSGAGLQVQAALQRPVGAANPEVPVLTIPEVSLPRLDASPPELPAAHRITPVTFDLVVERTVRGRGPATTHQTVSRTLDRVRMREKEQEKETEWLFVRNPVDPRRLSGFRTDHAARTVVAYEESEIRNWLGIRGWADVLTLGVNVEILKRLSAAGESRTVAGTQFWKYVETGEVPPRTEVWWGAAEALPLLVVSSDTEGAVRLTVESLRTGVDAALLELPASRWPEYRHVELSEWLEGD